MGWQTPPTLQYCLEAYFSTPKWALFSHQGLWNQRPGSSICQGRDPPCDFRHITQPHQPPSSHLWSGNGLLTSPSLCSIPCLSMLSITYPLCLSEKKAVCMPSVSVPLGIPQIHTRYYSRAFEKQLPWNLSCRNFMHLKSLSLEMMKWTLPIVKTHGAISQGLKNSSGSRIFIRGRRIFESRTDSKFYNQTGEGD